MTYLSPRFWCGFLAALVISSSLFASKLIYLKPVDQGYLELYLKDGETWFRDDGKGESAYKGHAFAEGDDKIVAFGEELDPAKATDVKRWTIRSEDDAAYGSSGKSPVAIFRRAKANNTDHSWNFKLDHWLFLELPSPLQQGANYELVMAEDLAIEAESTDFTFDVFAHSSEAVKVNLIGYPTQSPVKSADLYRWLGDGGPRDYRDFEGNRVWLLNTKDGSRHEVGEVTFWQDSQKEFNDWNLTGSPVWNVDFTGFNTPGSYRLVVEGVGRSVEFEISDEAYYAPYQTKLRGYYYMRVGEPITDIRPVPRQPQFMPEKDPAGFTVYLTELHPFHPKWDDHPGDTWDENHFKPAEESMFWANRPAGNPTNPEAYGGHSDAADWDRHLAHVSNIYAQLLPFLISGGSLDEDDLGIRESGNGIPDLIDEALNEIDMFLRLRDGEAYSHGLTNPSQEKTIMFQAGATTMAAWANAANCAMVAEAFRVNGNREMSDHYRREAITAYRFAQKQENLQLDDIQGIGDDRMRGRDFRQLAAAYLYNVTGDVQWEDALVRDSVAQDPDANIFELQGWNQVWATAAYLMTKREVRHPEIQANMRASLFRQARADYADNMDWRPSRRSTNHQYWVTPQNMDLVVLAHHLSDDPAEKEYFLKSLILEADWALGRNPGNIVEMTGLGERCIVNCYTSGRNDGSPGLHPGHTPYNNLNPWGTTHIGSMPQWFTERGYPAWKDGWPRQEAHFNSRYSWTNGEFTPRQTMRGKMTLYAYLYSLRGL